MKPNFWLRCQPELSHHIRTSWRDQCRVKLWSDIQFGTSFSPIPSKGINQRQPSLNHLPSLHLSFFQFTFTSKSCYLKNKTKTKQVERCLISLTFGLKLCDLDFAERSYLFFLSFFFWFFELVSSLKSWYHTILNQIHICWFWSSTHSLSYPIKQTWSLSPLLLPSSSHLRSWTQLSQRQLNPSRNLTNRGVELSGEFTTLVIQPNLVSDVFSWRSEALRG